MVAFELWFGVARSQRPQVNARRLDAFFAGSLALLPFDDADARTAGQVRATLAAAGTPIGPFDVMIAGQAMRRGMTLATASVSEFRRVSGLVWEDWAVEATAGQ